MSHSALAAGLRRLHSKLASQQRHDDSDEQLLHAFTSQRDDNAFAALVHRHGPMVLHVCRRVLEHEHDAEDAFQATFLVLARYADTLRKKTALGCFLHGTAYRLALSAKRAAARRRQHERQAMARPSINPVDELSWREVRTLLDEEVARLPVKYRSIFILCCLEEQSQAEAARRLGVNERTVSHRLAEARKRLKRRLARRGVELTAVLAVSGVSLSSASALPPVLVAATIKAAAATAAGEGLAAAISAPVAALVKEMASRMMVRKMKTAVLLLLAGAVFGGSGVWAYRGLTMPALALPGEPPAAKAEDKPIAASPPRKPTEKREIHGRVLGPDGNPKAGAKLVLLGEDGAVKQLGETAADGHFAVTIATAKKSRSERLPALLAQSRDAGLDFVSLAGWDAAKPVELRLVKDHPIRGRIVNTEGKPISGVRVSVSDIDVYPNNSLDSARIRGRVNRANGAAAPAEKTLQLRAASLLTALTDAEGRFVILGVGGERVAKLALRDGGIADTELWVANRAGFDPKTYTSPAFEASLFVPTPPKRLNPPPTYGRTLEGPDLTFIAEPEKPIRGTVKDADSGKGVPNVSIRLEQEPTEEWRNFPVAKTDAQGRYEFHGARKTKTYPFHIDSDSTAGYLATQVNIGDNVGYSPLNVDFRLKKGVIVTGKIIDRATGKSVPGFAQFAVLVNNPFKKGYPPFYSGFARKRDNTAANGTFRVVVIPGPVLLMGGYYPPPTEKFDYLEFSKYRLPVADPNYPQYFSKLPGGRSTDDVGYHAYGGGTSLIQGNDCKVLDIKPGTAEIHQDLFLERASVLEVKIQDADGQPVRGVEATDFAIQRFISPLWIERSTCPVYGLELRKPRLLIFYEPKRKIIASRRLQGDEKGPIVVKLGPLGALKGRLLDRDGKPLAGAAVTVLYRDSYANHIHWRINSAKQVVTDANGAFTLEELVPELKFELTVRRGKQRFAREAKSVDAAIQVKPAECRDLGDIRMKTQ